MPQSKKDRTQVEHIGILSAYKRRHGRILSAGSSVDGVRGVRGDAIESELLWRDEAFVLKGIAVGDGVEDGEDLRTVGVGFEEGGERWGGDAELSGREDGVLDVYCELLEEVSEVEGLGSGTGGGDEVVVCFEACVDEGDQQEQVGEVVR